MASILDQWRPIPVYDPNTLSFVMWDGSLRTGALTIGTVDQGAAGASAWTVDGSAVTQPVSISGSVPVTAAALPLPTGAATQATLASALTELQSILATLNASIAVTGTFFQATQPVSVAALPLPANAAQETGGHLATLATVDFATGAQQDTIVAALAPIGTAQGATGDGALGPFIQGLVSDSRESYLTNTIRPVSLTSEGRLRVTTDAPVMDLVPEMVLTGATADTVYSSSSPWSF